MAQIGLPQTSIPIALLFFNVGVEVGQLLFIVCMFAAFVLTRRIARRIEVLRPDRAWGAWAYAVPPCAIGSLAVFWLLQRIADF